MADQSDLVAAVEDQDLIGQVDLDPQAPAAGDEHRRELRAGQRPLHGRAHRVLDRQALDRLEGPYGFESVGAEPSVGRPWVILERGQSLLQLHDCWSAHPRLKHLTGGRR